MARFTYSNFDKLSFWIGFITGILFWWLLTRTRINRDQLKKWVQRVIQGVRSVSQSTIEWNYRNDLLNEVQKKHLAASLFSLDEICVSPRLLAPPPRIEPGGPIPLETISDQIIPYTPDWPQIASAVDAFIINLPLLLSSNSNFILIGQPGLGKTTALCLLVTDLVRQTQPRNGNKIPVFLHVGNLIFNLKNYHEPIEPIINAVGVYCSSKTKARLKKYLATIFSLKRALILIDGLDELPPKKVDEAINYIEQLFEWYPGIQIITTASDQYYGKLPKLGFIPVALVPWNQDQKINFLTKWDTGWDKHISPLLTKEPSQTTTILREWLLRYRKPVSPLEFTLNVWSFYAEDTRGADLNHGIEDFIARVTAGEAEDAKALEKLALQIYISQNPLISLKEIDRWEFKLGDLNNATSFESEREQTKIFETTDQNIKNIKISRSIPRLIERGLVWLTANDYIGIAHPTVIAYLAAKAIQRYHSALNPQQTLNFFDQNRWATSVATLEFMVANLGEQSLINQIIEQNTQPLNNALFVLARSLSIAPTSAEWGNIALKSLAIILKEDHLPIELKSKILTALIYTGNRGVNILLEDLLNSDRSELRFLGALGVCLCSDPEFLDRMVMLLNDPVPSIQCAACLALAAIGSKKCIDALTASLYHGDEELQRAAAEALSRMGETEHEILRDAIGVDDLLVRRAVIFGLHRLGTNWAIELLERMGYEDSQWVVKDAAIQALESLKQADTRILNPHPSPSETAWLIAYAAAKGEGIPAGSPALDIYLSALYNGDKDQKLAAIDYLKFHGDASIIPSIKEIYFADHGELKSAAFDALWHLSLSGFEV